MMKGIENKVLPFITKNPGLESGYMIAHVTAAALSSENKTLSHPASVDNITTSGGQEDFVSMAPWSGKKLLNIQKNIFYIISIELIVSGAAKFLNGSKYKSGKGLEPVLKLLNSKCNYNCGDRSLTNEIESISELVMDGTICSIVSKKINLE